MRPGMADLAFQWFHDILLRYCWLLLTMIDANNDAEVRT